MEPTLEEIEDYHGKESREKRLTVYIVILSGLLIGAIYGLITSSARVPTLLIDKPSFMTTILYFD